MSYIGVELSDIDKLVTNDRADSITNEYEQIHLAFATSVQLNLAEEITNQTLIGDISQLSTVFEETLDHYNYYLLNHDKNLIGSLENVSYQKTDADGYHYQYSFTLELQSNSQTIGGSHTYEIILTPPLEDGGMK